MGIATAGLVGAAMIIGATVIGLYDAWGGANGVFFFAVQYHGILFFIVNHHCIKLQDMIRNFKVIL